MTEHMQNMKIIDIWLAEYVRHFRQFSKELAFSQLNAGFYTNIHTPVKATFFHLNSLSGILTSSCARERDTVKNGSSCLSGWEVKQHEGENIKITHTHPCVHRSDVRIPPTSLFFEHIFIYVSHKIVDIAAYACSLSFHSFSLLYSDTLLEKQALEILFQALFYALNMML